MRLRVWFSVAAGILAVFGFSIFFLYKSYPQKYMDEIAHYSQESSLILALIRVESGFRPLAISEKGALGLMQILPETAEYVCALYGYEQGDLLDPAYNIKIGVSYLGYLRSKFENYKTALAAYNAGEGTVRRWLSDPDYSNDGKTLQNIPYAETERYVKKIEIQHKIYKILYQND